MAGAHDASEAYVGRLAELARAGAEVLICVASERDEAVRAGARAMARRADPDRQRRHLQSQAEQRAQGPRGGEPARRGAVRRRHRAHGRRSRRGCGAIVGRSRAGAGAQGRRAAGKLRGRDGMRLHQRPSGALPAGRRPAGHACRVGRRDDPHQGRPGAHRRSSGLPQLHRRRLFRRAHSARPCRTDHVARQCHAKVAAGPPPLVGRMAPSGPLGLDAAQPHRRGEGAGAVRAGDRLARLGTCRRRRPWSPMASARAIWRSPSPCTRWRGSRPRHGSSRAAACRSDRAPGRRRWRARRWCRCWLHRPGADATESTGAAPTWPRAGVPGMAPPERAYENDERHGGHRHRHAAGARRFGDLGRRSRR